MRLLREDHQTGSRQLDLIADWGLPVFFGRLLVFFAVSMPCSTTCMSASELRVRESRNAIAQAASGSRATTASRRGLVMAFQAARMGYSALMWGIEVGCVGSPYEANPGGSPDVENTAQPGFAAYHPCVR